MATITPAGIVLLLLRLVLLGFSLGLTLISFRAYRDNRTERLKYAFVGFASISTGVAVTSLTTQLLFAARDPTTGLFVGLQVAGAALFCVGFGALYYSLYS
ncbi:DUF7521 family protein [Halosegnis longus]|uniref:Uncharacterized protein n=2 Tax=Halosegnis longus TaxID=2216012 RepID=A0AAJ4R767_9EURY|nr:MULTISPECIES: hypothetical protein [Halobacteriales]RNJ25708.1 hypothetical protein Nmn1133_02720 [Salella cibi]